MALIITLMLAADTALAQGTADIWEATYWNNKSLSGFPVLERREASIDYNWGTGSPHPDVDDDDFSVRWVGNINFRPATYRFAATSDDGIRVWVDGALIIDEWYDHPAQTFTAEKNLSGGRHRIVIEYYEDESGAIAQFWWAPAPPSDGQNWRGEYYNNTSLSGQPALVRQDPVIDFNWTSVPPGPGLNADRFSARWTRTIDLPAGSYRFDMTVDDGGRLWVNGRFLIDAWEIQSPRTYSAEIYLPGGPTPIKMEYFDNRLGAVARLSWTSAPLRTDFWRGEYFNGTSFEGAPVLVRNDPEIDFDWGSGSPTPKQLGQDRFAIRWRRTLDLPPGRYRFTMTIDDGGRLWINDRLLIDAWRVQSPRTYTGEIEHVSDRPLSLRMEYFENTRGALARLSWSRIGPAFQTSRDQHVPILHR